jgi:hypothetical protein
MSVPRRAAPLLPLLLLLAAAPAHAQPPDDLQGAIGVVMQQLEAFRRDDFDAAYAFASREIKQAWDRQGFETMVRQGYPEIARSTHAFVAHARRGDGGHLYLGVKIGGANGNTIEALYEMVWEDDRWKVNGVVTRPETGERVSVPGDGVRTAGRRPREAGPPPGRGPRGSRG